jgi:hypothetical protein
VRPPRNHCAIKEGDRAVTPSTITTETSKGSRLAPILDQKLADAGLPLFGVVDWYGKAYLATRSLDSDRSVNEDAALWLGIEEFKSEAKIGTRPCQCIRPDPNVCECWKTLKASRAALMMARASQPVPEPVPDHDNSDKPTHEEFVKAVAEVERELANRVREVLRLRGDKVIPQQINLWSAVLFLAPLGNELARELLGLALRARTLSQMEYDPTPLPEILFQDRRYITLLYAAFATHPRYAHCDDPAPLIRRWQELGIADVESAYLVDWFCTTHPMQVLRIERDLKLKMGKQGWRV